MIDHAKLRGVSTFWCVRYNALCVLETHLLTRDPSIQDIEIVVAYRAPWARVKNLQASVSLRFPAH